MEEKKKKIELSLDDEMVVFPEVSEKLDIFIKIAKKSVLKMNKEKDDFLKEAAKALVRNVLAQEFGVQLTQDKGFPQMEEIIAQKLIKSPQYRKSVKRLLKIINRL